MKLSYFAGAIGALALAASTAQAQSKLTTLFASNNGGSTGGIVYFDVTVKAGVIISAFETNVDVAASTSIGLDVYTCPTTYVGNEGNQAAWTQVATDNGQAVSAGSGDVASLVTLQTPLTLTPGTYGMALIAKNFGHDYTNGSGTNQSYQDNFLKLDLGAAYNSPWGASPFSPRVWNGSVIYNPAAGIFANFSATPVEGKSPLQVQFTDATFTDDPNGVSKWEWDFNNDQIVDSTMQNPTFVFTGVGYDVKYTVSLKATDVKNGSSTETKKDFIVVNPFPVASATSFGQGSTVPAGVPGPMQMPAFASTYSYVTDVRGFFAQAPTTFAITSFNVPNEAQATDQSVWFFTFPGTTAPSSYAVTAADTKFVGSGPVTAPLTPTTPIVIQQGTWFGVLGCCHDSVGTTQHNSYGNGGFTTTILGAPTVVNRLYHSAR
jgi:PKD repeat protein